MATTEKGIYYPADYDEVADIPDDMKKMAESIDDVIEHDRGLVDEFVEETNQKIETIQAEQTTQNENIQENTDSIEALETKHDTEVAELQSQIEDLQEKVDMAEDLIPTDSPEISDNITLSDSARYYFKKIVLGGKSEQETFTGKNLLEVLTNVYKDRGLTTTKLSDGGFKVTGTAMSTYSFIIYNEPINLEPGTYTFSIKESLTTNLRLFPMLEDGTTEGSMTISAGSKSTTTTFTNKIIGIRILLFTTEGTNYDLTIYPMIEQGSTATDYEPYTNGPAPNPDYECPIHNVTGNVEVKVENANLWDENWEVGEINGTTGIKANTGEAIRSKNYIKVTPNQAYYFYIGTTNYMNVYQYDSNKNYIGALTGRRNEIITLSNKCYYILFSTATSYGTVYNNNICINLSNPEINGNYFAHEEQTVTFPLEEGQVLHENDTIEDKIVQRRITIDLSTLTWNKATTTDSQGNTFGFYATLTERPKQDTTGVNFALCNILKQQKRSEVSIIDTEGFYLGSGATLYIKIKQSLIPNGTVAELNTLLTNTNATLEYELETPIEIPFTQAQRQAKAQIDKLYSYKGTTHITSNANLDVTYRKDLETMFDKMEELDARLSLLES